MRLCFELFANDDTALTCLVCGNPSCEFGFEVKGAIRSYRGIHERCATPHLAEAPGAFEHVNPGRKDVLQINLGLNRSLDFIRLRDRKQYLVSLATRGVIGMRTLAHIWYEQAMKVAAFLSDIRPLRQPLIGGGGEGGGNDGNGSNGAPC